MAVDTNFEIKTTYSHGSPMTKTDKCEDKGVISQSKEQTTILSTSIIKCFWKDEHSCILVSFM